MFSNQVLLEMLSLLSSVLAITASVIMVNTRLIIDKRLGDLKEELKDMLQEKYVSKEHCAMLHSLRYNEVAAIITAAIKSTHEVCKNE